MAEYEIAATWAIVGFLFARSNEELRHWLPVVRPQYQNAQLNPYGDWGTGSREDEDLRYAPHLIDQIAATPRQEVACHTFSHYYCLEAGQRKPAFRADLESAIALAAHRGFRLRSLVYPRNQVNPDYQDLLPKLGFTSFRGAEVGMRFDSSPQKRKALWRRAGRWLDQYSNGATVRLRSWEQIPCDSNLANVAGTLFLRPYSPVSKSLDELKFARIKRAINAAAEERKVLHIWWHPHNFGLNTQHNLKFLRRIFDAIARARGARGLLSLTMAQAADLALAPYVPKGSLSQLPSSPPVRGPDQLEPGTVLGAHA